MGGFQGREPGAARAPTAPGRTNGSGATPAAVGKQTLTGQLPVDPASSSPGPGVSSPLQPGAMPYRVPPQSLDTLAKHHGEPAVRWAHDSLPEGEIELLLTQLTPEAIPTIEDIPAIDARGLLDQVGAKRVNDALSLGPAGPVRGKQLDALRRNVAPAVMTDLLDSAGTNRGRLVRVARVADGIEPAGALLGAEPLAAGSVAIDSNVRIAIDELVRGVGSAGQRIDRFADLPDTRQNAINAVRQARGLGPYVDPPPGTRPTIEAVVGPGADLRTTQLAGAEAMVNETGTSKSPTLATMKGTATNRSHPDYALVIEELKNASIGTNKGAVDRSLIADAMFAENAAGSPPKLVTADEAVCVGLARKFATSPRTFSPTSPAGGRYWEQLIARFPEGHFTVEIHRHKLEVYFQEPSHAAPSPP